MRRLRVGLASQTSGGLGRHCPAQLHGSVGKPAGGADERGRNPAESRAFRMGAPVRFQKAVSRSNENAAVKRRKASRPASRGRQVPSAEGTGPTARRPPDARNAPAPVGASPPWYLGAFPLKAAGRLSPRSDGACLVDGGRSRNAAGMSSSQALLLCAGLSPFVPAEAGTQFLQQSLGPRIRGGERSLNC